MVLLLITMIGIAGCSSRPVIIDRFVPETGTSYTGLCADVPSDAYAINVCTLNQSVAYYDVSTITNDPYVLVVV